MTVAEYRATITPDLRAARKRERDNARAIRRLQRFADRLFIGVAVCFCLFMMLAVVLAAGR